MMRSHSLKSPVHELRSFRRVSIELPPLRDGDGKCRTDYYQGERTTYSLTFSFATPLLSAKVFVPSLVTSIGASTIVIGTIRIAFFAKWNSILIIADDWWVIHRGPTRAAARIIAASTSSSTILAQTSKRKLLHCRCPSRSIAISSASVSGGSGMSWVS